MESKKELVGFMDSVSMGRFIKDEKVKHLLSSIKSTVEKMEKKQNKNRK